MKLIKVIDFDNYYKKEYDKKFVVLHHTASGDNVHGVLSYWKSKSYALGTAYIIDRNGKIYEVFNPFYWAYHLGTQRSYGKHLGVMLEQQSIGIELISWGALIKKGDKFLSWAGVEVPKNEVVTYQKYFRARRYYHAYTQKQIDALFWILQKLKRDFGLSYKQITSKFYDFSKILELENVPEGIFSHTNFRRDKTDVHPQPELRQMLQELRANNL